MSRRPDTGHRTGVPLRTLRRLGGAGVAVGFWSLLPPYTGPALDTASRVELADHVIPGVIVLAVAALCRLGGPLLARPGLAVLVAGLAVALAGIWMTATHVPLVAQAARGEAPWDATVYHGLPGLAVLALGVWWSVVCWHDEEAPPA